MKKIIKKGTKAIMKCDNCGCEFSYEEEDTHTALTNHLRSKYTTTTYLVDCPQCDTACVIKDKPNVK